MRTLYECGWCRYRFHNRSECEEHEPVCNNNPDARACETCDHSGDTVADTGKVWNTCDLNLINTSCWRDNHTVRNCPQWKNEFFDSKNVVQNLKDAIQQPFLNCGLCGHPSNNTGENCSNKLCRRAWKTEDGWQSYLKLCEDRDEFIASQKENESPN